MRVEGRASKLPAAESDRYFASRPRDSQLGAWASPQSRELARRADLEERLQQVRTRFEGVDIVPRPEGWGGFLVAPTRIEFWQGRPSRLHDRLVFSRTEGGWTRSRLAP